jgi:hypothetical protein
VVHKVRHATRGGGKVTDLLRSLGIILHCTLEFYLFFISDTVIFVEKIHIVVAGVCHKNTVRNRTL